MTLKTIINSGRTFIENPARAILGYWRADEIYQQPADGHGISYLNELVTEYRSLPKTEANDRAQKVIDDLLAKFQTQRATWDDINSFELALVKLLPKEKLFKKAWSLREEYREIAGADDWQAYQSSNPPILDSDKTDIEKVRADAEQLLLELEWLYTTMPTQEKQRNELLINIVFSGLVFVIAGGAVCYWDSCVIGLVFIFGTAGAIFSAWQRMQQLPLSSNEEVNLSKLNSYGVSAQLAPAVGGLAAILLMLLFISGLVSGALFPVVDFKSDVHSEERHVGNFSSSTNDLTKILTNAVIENDVTSTNKFRSTNSPPSLCGCECGSPCRYRICISDGKNWALLLVWSFIAGFSERLVPDIINRLANRAESK